MTSVILFHDLCRILSFPTPTMRNPGSNRVPVICQLKKHYNPHHSIMIIVGVADIISSVSDGSINEKSPSSLASTFIAMLSTSLTTAPSPAGSLAASRITSSRSAVVSASQDLRSSRLRSPHQRSLSSTPPSPGGSPNCRGPPLKISAIHSSLTAQFTQLQRPTALVLAYAESFDTLPITSSCRRHP